MAQASSSTIIAGVPAVLARRYAEAFYELADEQKQLDAVANDLRGLKSLLQNREFQTLTGNPRLSRSQLVKAIQQISTSAGLSKLTGNFLGVMAQNRRLEILDAVINSFLAELAKRRGEFTAEVRSAQPLTGPQQEQLAGKLRELAGGKVHLTLQEDKSLLGGLVVKLGSRLIDASVKSKLARLERQLKSQSLSLQKGAA